MSASMDRLQAVLLTGTLGSGKTALAVEMGELLGEDGLAHAVIDLDWLAWLRPAEDRTDWTIDRVLAENLTLVVSTFRSAGVRHLVMARALLRRSQLDLVRRALPDADVTVFRITASVCDTEIVGRRFASIS
jgi:adenylylsulfate kinase-like enzyme